MLQHTNKNNNSLLLNCFKCFQGWRNHMTVWAFSTSTPLLLKHDHQNRLKQRSRIPSAWAVKLISSERKKKETFLDCWNWKCFFLLLQNWQIPLGSRFRSLKLWFVMRSYGAEGLRDYIRKQVKLAEEFYQMLSVDDRFEFPVPPAMHGPMGFVCFRLKVRTSMQHQSYKIWHHLMDFFILWNLFYYKL